MRLLATIAAVLCFGTATIVANDVTVVLDSSQFKVIGWKAPVAPPGGDWSSVLLIRVGSGAVPPLLGSYAVEDGFLVFHPAYPIAAGVQYRITLRLPDRLPIEQTIDGPAVNPVSVAHVLQVYPTADILPSNQLRLYIYFSAPMSRGEAARYVHILDDKGDRLEGAQAVFLPGEELWDPRYQRLTLTFDPGRIKRGLTSNQTIGPPIAEGKGYTLVIDRAWPDARGLPMSEGFQKTFRGGQAERTPPDPAAWRLVVPKAGTSEPLTVTFPTPMNYPLLQRMLVVSGAHGDVDGMIAVDRQETEWRFFPLGGWKPGDYRLVVDKRIEDLAGNHIGQLFDIDTFERVTDHISAATVSIPFAVR